MGVSGLDRAEKRDAGNAIQEVAAQQAGTGSMWPQSSPAGIFGPMSVGRPTSTALSAQLQLVLGPAYTIERELGGGGMSRVFVAHDHSLASRVVVEDRGRRWPPR